MLYQRRNVIKVERTKEQRIALFEYAKTNRTWYVIEVEPIVDPEVIECDARYLDDAIAEFKDFVNDIHNNEKL